VYDALVEMIITRELQPGQHLVENDLAAALGVSRQPVREALLRMESEGWVEQRQSQGTFVHVPTDSEADELLSVRTLLEAESARLAALHSTPEHVERLQELQRNGEAALDSGSDNALVAANAELHDYVVFMSDNPVLADMINSIARRMRWYYKPIAGRRGHDSWREHAEFIEAIAQGDSRRAQVLMRKHTERTRDVYHRLTQEPAES